MNEQTSKLFLQLVVMCLVRESRRNITDGICFSTPNAMTFFLNGKKFL